MHRFPHLAEFCAGALEAHVEGVLLDCANLHSVVFHGEDVRFKKYLDGDDEEDEP